jgi:hypothetical protein
MLRRVLVMSAAAAALAALFVSASREPKGSELSAGGWDTASCATNAHLYAKNPSIIANLGTFNSGCAELRFEGISLKEMRRVNDSLAQLIAQVGAQSGCIVISLNHKTGQPEARPCRRP